jgi:phage repressor protein C with HTH and peptisase S24 domain
VVALTLGPEDCSPLGQFILAYLQSHNLSVSKLAERCGLSQPGLRDLMLKDRSSPRADTLVKIAQGMEVPIEEILRLVFGNAVELRTPEKAFDRDYALVPRYSVYVSAGNGAPIEYEQVEELLALHRDWIRRELNANPDQLYVLNVVGQSMEPLLRAGDLVFVDRSCRQRRTDGVYVLRLDGCLLVKSLQWLPGGKVRVQSENPAFENYTVGAQDLEVLGRVVWAGRRF